MSFQKRKHFPVETRTMLEDCVSIFLLEVDEEVGAIDKEEL